LRRLGDQVRHALRRADAWHGEFTARLPLPAFCKSRTMTALIAVLAILLFVYVGLAAMLYFTQRSMMYFPETIHTSPAEAGLPEAEEISLTAADGVHIVGWHVAPRDGKPVILYLHGNGGALRYRVERFRRLIKEGVGLVAIEYRGYGGSEGSPSEAGLFADAEAAYAFAAAATGRIRSCSGANRSAPVSPLSGGGEAGRPRHPGSAVHVHGGGRGAALLVHAGAAC
jgi:fermentation-respiration switch protein FrsA (DUF1100 family)